MRCRFRSSVAFATVALATILAALVPCRAADVTLAWDRSVEADVIGYRVYYGRSPARMINTVEVPGTPQAIIPNLPDGYTYFFTVTAYNRSGLESFPSEWVSYSPPATESGGTTTTSRGFLNVSTRCIAHSGENVAIGGFIIAGEEGKKVVLRAIGPSLREQGVERPMHDPTLELYDSSGVLLQLNDDWLSDPEAVEETGVAPLHGREAAIVASLGPGAYTAVIRGADGESGTVLFELYDLQPDRSRIAAISTRASIDSSDEMMIAGFIAGGGNVGLNTILVRAIGPSLTASGITGALADPVLEMFDANGSLIFRNDSWRSSQSQQIAASSLAPPDDREAAVIVTVPSGNYSAVVRGGGSGTGVGLLEVYHLQ